MFRKDQSVFHYTVSLISKFRGLIAASAWAKEWPALQDDILVTSSVFRAARKVKSCFLQDRSDNLKFKCLI